MRVVLASLALSLVGFSAAASDWRFYDGVDETMLVIDIDSIRAGPKYSTAWVAHLNKVTDRFGADYILVRHEVDCTEATVSRTNFTAYTVEGVTIGSVDRATPHEPVRPDSVSDTLVKAVCNQEYGDLGTSDIMVLLKGHRSR
jgi:hypothetical protein